jgi:hypothetical protein
VSCPVRLTDRYFAFLGTWQGSVVPLSNQKDRRLPHESRVMSYTNASEDMKHVLALINVDASGFAEHSMKRGGATEAARRGATASEICIAGDWSNQKIAEKYIDQPNCHNQILKKFLE